MAFKESLIRILAGIPSGLEQIVLRNAIGPLVDRFSSQPLTSAGLVIKAGGGVLAKTGASTFYAAVDGKLRSIAAATDMPALTGLVITANSFNVACFFVDEAGTMSALFGTEGTSIAAVKFPAFPEKKALIGFLLITHSSTFTGGTTPLDTATTVYVSPLGPFDPSALLGF